MKIAFDTFNLGVTTASGNKTYTVELIKALHKNYPEDVLQLITFWRKKKGCTTIFNQDDTLLIKPSLPHTKLLGKDLEELVRASYRFFEWKIGNHCDLFHCTNPISYPFNMPKVVTTIHDLIALYDESWVPENVKPFLRRNLKTIVERSELLFANSCFTADELLQRFPASKEKVVITPLAANPCFKTVPAGRTFLQTYGIKDIMRPYLLSVGEIHPRKNTLAMIKGFEIAASKQPDLLYILIGQAKEKEYVQQVFSHCNSSPVKDRIIFLHNVTIGDLVHFYNNAIGIAFFSLFEGFGLPIIEAMACGCPVATSRSSSMTEIAEHAAIMVDPKNFDSIVSGLSQLINDATLRTELKEKGLRRAEEYSWIKTAKLTYEGYKKVVQ